MLRTILGVLSVLALALACLWYFSYRSVQAPSAAADSPVLGGSDGSVDYRQAARRIHNSILKLAPGRRQGHGQAEKSSNTVMLYINTSPLAMMPVVTIPESQINSMFCVWGPFISPELPDNTYQFLINSTGSFDPRKVKDSMTVDLVQGTSRLKETVYADPENAGGVYSALPVFSNYWMNSHPRFLPQGKKASGIPAVHNLNWLVVSDERGSGNGTSLVFKPMPAVYYFQPGIGDKPASAVAAFRQRRPDGSAIRCFVSRTGGSREVIIPEQSGRILGLNAIWASRGQIPSN